MILKNKKLLVVTSLLTLLPIPVGLLLWNRFPGNMAVHFGLTGQADGFAGRDAAVFVLPLVMLLTHWICILFTALDKNNRNRNQKLQAVVLWTVPVLTNLSMAGMYAFALGVEFSPVAWTMIPVGVLFAVIGNYMPKTRMNSTIGIRIPWTFSSEENWNATHRLAGKLWVVGGIGTALCAPLSHMWALVGMFSLIFLMVLVPMVYSWHYYRMQKARGDDVTIQLSPNRKHTKASLAALILILCFCAVLLFTGNIEAVYNAENFSMKASYYSDLTLRYDAIREMEYRDGNVPGLRVGGFGSFRLLMGWFENEEFGTHVRYTYYSPDACVVVKTDTETYILSGKNPEETADLYQTLLEKTGK